MDAIDARQDTALFKVDFMAYASLYKQPVVLMGCWQVLIASEALLRHGDYIEATRHPPAPFAPEYEAENGC